MKTGALSSLLGRCSQFFERNRRKKIIDKKQRMMPPPSSRDENPWTTRSSFHEPTPSNSYRRGRCNVDRGVSFGGRTTSFHGVQKGAEGRRSTVAPCRGGSTAPTRKHLRIPRIRGSKEHEDALSNHHVEREAHTDAPPRLLNRALSLSLYRWRCADGG